MSNEEILTLWILRAFNDEQGAICPVYASSEVKARQQANSWIIEQAMFGLRNIEAKHYPGGFLAGASTWWPGRIPTKPEQSEVQR